MNKKGFTIVELLVVIVVIAILAAVSIVVYNGIQARVENSKTVAAVSAWTKALQLYKADMGTYPPQSSCLGSSTTYTNSNNGRCWGANNNSTWIVQSGFVSSMSPYISNQPEPSQVNIRTDIDQRRGAIFYRVAAGDDRVYVIVIGSNPCPSIGGLGITGSSTLAAGKECYYRLPQ